MTAGRGGCVLIAGRMLTAERDLPELGWLRLNGDRILERGDGTPPEKPDLGGPHALITPGFIDAHLHLPQFTSIGCDGLELLDWLQQVIYPAERRWREADTAESRTALAYQQLLEAGTLGFAGFLSSHPTGVTAAVRAAHRLPLRAIVGQVLMDRHAPDDLLNQPIARLSRSTRGRMDTSLNPRFAIACSDALLAETGRRLAEGFPHSFKVREPDDMGQHLFVQTHLAESEAECARVRELFPDDPHYTGVYDRHGLLGRHALLAHGVHLSKEEWSLIAERHSVIVHCPQANTFLRSGLFDLRAALDAGVRLALGSDIAAGSDRAMPRVARSMIEVAKLRRLMIDDRAYIPTPRDAWRMITLDNAAALAWPDAGRLDPGASADLLILRAPFDADEHLYGRLLYTWRNEYIAHRIVAGQPVTTV